MKAIPAILFSFFFASKNAKKISKPIRPLITQVKRKKSLNSTYRKNTFKRCLITMQRANHKSELMNKTFYSKIQYRTFYFKQGFNPKISNYHYLSVASTTTIALLLYVNGGNNVLCSNHPQNQQKSNPNTINCQKIQNTDGRVCTGLQYMIRCRGIIYLIPRFGVLYTAMGVSDSSEAWQLIPEGDYFRIKSVSNSLVIQATEYKRNFLFLEEINYRMSLREPVSTSSDYYEDQLWELIPEDDGDGFRIKSVSKQLYLQRGWGTASVADDAVVVEFYTGLREKKEPYDIFPFLPSLIYKDQIWKFLPTKYKLKAHVYDFDFKIHEYGNLLSSIKEERITSMCISSELDVGVPNTIETNEFEHEVEETVSWSWSEKWIKSVALDVNCSLLDEGLRGVNFSRSASFEEGHSTSFSSTKKTKLKTTLTMNPPKEGKYESGMLVRWANNVEMPFQAKIEIFAVTTEEDKYYSVNAIKALLKHENIEFTPIEERDASVVGYIKGTMKGSFVVLTQKFTREVGPSKL